MSRGSGVHIPVATASVLLWRGGGVGMVLGNVVILKKFLPTRKIMVMHSNKRGECCLRTLVDRSRKRYINAVDVVVRLHVRPS